MALLAIVVNTLSGVMCGVIDLLGTSPTDCVLHPDLAFANASGNYDFSLLASLLQSFALLLIIFSDSQTSIRMHHHTVLIL